MDIRTLNLNDVINTHHITGMEHYEVLEITYISPYGKQWTTKNFKTIINFCEALVNGEVFKATSVKEKGVKLLRAKINQNGVINTITYRS